MLPWQERVFSNSSRYRVVAAGLGTGKTFLAMHELFRAAMSIKNGMVVYVAPSPMPVRLSVWRLLLDAIPNEIIESVNDWDMSLVLKPTGSTIRLFGAESTAYFCGLNIDFAVLEHAAYTPEEIWHDRIRPSLASRQGRVLFMSAPNGVEGPGRWFYDLYRAGRDPNTQNWMSYEITTLQAGLMPATEILEAYRNKYPAYTAQWVDEIDTTPST
jgi:hypothetical protein